MVVCLSHLGYDYGQAEDLVSDRKLAAQTHGIDIILGGHTHTFLTEPNVLKNSKGVNVLVNQVGWAGILLGRIDFYFDKDKKISKVSFQNQFIDNKIIV